MRKQGFLKALLVISVIAAMAITVCFGLVACTPEEHQHTYSDAWNNDATNHWHDATCEHTTEKGDLAAHDTNGTDGACSVCGYKPTTSTHQHALSGWQKDATEHYKTCTGANCTAAAGTKFEKAAHDTKGQDGACSVCGYKPATSTHQHTLSGWQYDDNEHYKTCIGENCTEPAGTRIEKAEHDNANGDCVCGYHVHTYATEWSHDATNHWLVATCAHTEEKSGFGAHNTNGTDGECSVCGYSVYNELAAKEGMIIAEKFETAQAKLNEFGGTYGTKGLYSYNGDDTHYVKIDGGQAKLVKSDAGEASLLIDFGLTSGTVEGYFEATIDGATNNSWTFLRIVNVSGKEVFGLRSSGGNVKYRLNEGSETDANTTVAFSKTTYKIYFLFDGATKKFTMTINGLDFVKDLELSVSELGGIRLVSGNSHAGVVYLDNLVIVNDITFAELKAAATAKLQAVYATYNLANDYATNGAQVTTAKETGETEIAAAETADAIMVAYNKAVAAMQAVKSELNIYQDEKIEALTNYATGKGESNYSADNWAKLQGEVAKGEAAIKKAKDNAAVDAALEAAKTAVDAVPDNSEQNELNNRDDCEITVYTPDTENAKTLDFTTAPASQKTYKADDAEGFLTFTSIGGGTKHKDPYLSTKGNSIATFTTTTANATITFAYSGSNSGRVFDIKYKASADAAEVVVYSQQDHSTWDKVNGDRTHTFTLKNAGTYTIVFDSYEHKIKTITLTETTSTTVTAKVNAVTATVVETATAGVTVANLVSKVTVQLDNDGEMTTSEITEKDQYTVIVKDSTGAEVSADTLEAGTYTVLVIFGSGKTESNATQYNSHTYTVTVTAEAAAD